MSRIEIDELYYNLNDKTASVTNMSTDTDENTYPNLKNKDIIIPETVEYKGKNV
jgi:hypothetical protein